MHAHGCTRLYAYVHECIYTYLPCAHAGLAPGVEEIWDPNVNFNIAKEVTTDVIFGIGSATLVNHSPILQQVGVRVLVYGVHPICMHTDKRTRASTCTVHFSAYACSRDRSIDRGGGAHLDVHVCR